MPSSKRRRQNASVCKFWRQGQCSKGGHCRFSHEKTVVASHKKQKKENNQDRCGEGISCQKQGTTVTQKIFSLVRPFLTIPDLQKCSSSSQNMAIHLPSRTLTIRDILQDQNICIGGLLEIAELKKRITDHLTNEEKEFTATNEENQTLVFHPDCNLSSKIQVVTQQYMQERNRLFTTLFADQLSPFLTVNDMVACAQTGKAIHLLCRTWTVPELLSTKTLELSKSRRIELGTSVHQQVVAYREPNRARPTRVTILGESECFRAKLYHPAELPQIHEIMDHHLLAFGTAKKVATYLPSTCPVVSKTCRHPNDAPILLSARFGPSKKKLTSDNTMDVTEKLKEIIQTKGEGKCLVLKPPPVIRNGMGFAVTAPTTFRWWYTRLFGDPCPGISKSLYLRLKKPGTNVVWSKSYPENKSVDMELLVCDI